MPLPLVLAPPAAALIAIGLFLLIRWWIGRTGAALIFTFSLVLNVILIAPFALAILLAQEVLDFQQKASTAPKLLLVEKGPEILLAASFSEVKDLERGLSSFKPLGKEQVARLTQLGNTRYESLAKDYYKVIVVKRGFLEKLAGSLKAPSPGLPGTQRDAAVIQELLMAARDAFMTNDMDRLARTAVDLQKAFRDRGMSEGADLARQIEQAARARDLKALGTLAPRLLQFAVPGGSGLPGAGGLSGLAWLPALPVSGDVILKIIDAEDPAKELSPYLPAQTIQELSGGSVTNLKLVLIAYLLQARFQSGIDPLFLVSEYRSGNLEVYPASTISTLLRFAPL
ncbi:MAG TPA: hypothetical protein VJO15_07690 [Dehalococcoidia bacterium]|nr:hypothetical protein [Dehalococcoidia bacterium]